MGPREVRCGPLRRFMGAVDDVLRLRSVRVVRASWESDVVADSAARRPRRGHRCRLQGGGGL